MAHDAGWVKLHRKIFDNPLFKRKPETRHIFTDLLMLAVHQPSTADWNGPVELERGQVMVSVREVSELSGFSPKIVRSTFQQLERHKIVKLGKRPGNGPHVVTICNYDEYQDDGQRVGKAKANGRAKGGQTIKEEEEVKKKELLLEGSAESPVEEAARLYNEMAGRAGIAKWRTFAPERKSKLKARLKTYGMDGWKEALDVIERTDFCKGGGKDGWSVDFEWLITNDTNISKVLEGRYKNKNEREDDDIDRLTPKQLQQKLLGGHYDG